MDDAFVGKVRMSTGALFGVFVPNDITTQRVIKVAANMAVENMRDEMRNYDLQIDNTLQYIEALEQAIKDWADAIVDWEGVDFVERIKNEKSRFTIEFVLKGENNDE